MPLSISSLKAKLSAVFAIFQKNRSVFYINGPEQLPPPLSRNQENQMIAMFSKLIILVNSFIMLIKILVQLVLMLS